MCAWWPPRPVAQCQQFQEDAKDASVLECTWTLSALEALCNALYKFKTYLLTNSSVKMNGLRTRLISSLWTTMSWELSLNSTSHFNPFDECRTASSGRRPMTKPDDLGCDFACTGCQNLHPPSPFIIITQPESLYTFYRPTEGRRLSRPSWLVTYRDGLPVHRHSPILVLTGSDIARLRWSRPTHYRGTKPNRHIAIS